MENTTKATVCPDNSGNLPSCAPLATPYVPFQQMGSEQYQPSKGVARGTLFPGLDLPFRDMVNTNEIWGTPAAELTALGFAVKELQLYLDTHPKDQEVIELLSTYSTLLNEGSQRFSELYGPLNVTQTDPAKGFMWINNPWPWEYAASAED